MNSSSIVMAFIMAGVISMVAHYVVLGPVVLGLQNVEDEKQVAYIGHASRFEQLSVKKVEKPLSLSFEQRVK